MIYLRTGANGSCKTLFTLADVRALQLKEGRPVCWNGRFKLKPEKQTEFGWTLIDFKDWQAQKDGTIFLIDECHNDLPVRASAAAVPGHIRMLAEHRARGFDFFLLTQHPANIDKFVTKLIGAPGWHQHLKRVFGGGNMTRVLQWDAANNNCEKDGSGKTAQITTRGQPKEVFDWYDSAVLHTGKTRIPKQMYWAVGGIFLALVLAGLSVRAMQNNLSSKPAVESAAISLPFSGHAVPSRSSGYDKPPLTAAEYLSSRTPRFEGILHTAPVYDELTKPTRVPVPAGCIVHPVKGCRCYTQDATPYPADKTFCLAVIKDGLFLDFDQSSGRLPGRDNPPLLLPASD